MPKSRRKPARAQLAAARVSSTQNVKPWVKWVALAIVAALAISVIAGALTATPAHASTRESVSETGTAASLGTQASADTCLLDTDHDGIANPDDPDIDGDGIVNGEDGDIDGDGIVNSQDGDPASTNCFDSEPPIMVDASVPKTSDSAGIWGYFVTFGSAFAVVAVVVITLVSKRKKKG